MKNEHSLNPKVPNSPKERSARSSEYVDLDCTMSHKSLVRKTYDSCVQSTSSISKPPTMGGVE